MRIGIDFDNTIACYDGAFHAAALEQGLIPPGVGAGKNAVRDHLNKSGRQDAFTRLQGYIYGARMDLARPYDGFLAFVDSARAQGHDLFIVSHKTRVPLAGEPYDLHGAARAFLASRLIAGPARIPHEHIHFETSKEGKVARAAALGCHIFIDDLPEILALPGFPAGMRPILFDPEGHYAQAGLPYPRFSTWAGIAAVLLGGRA